MNLAELAIRNRLICTIVIVGVLAGGWYAYRNMARFEDPEFTIRTAAVVTRYPGATAEEVANEVTEALETAIQELEEVDEIVSTSSIGLSSINVDVKYEFSRTRADLELVWAKLRNRIRDARDRLPPGALEPVVNDGFGDVYGLYYLVTGEGFSPREVHDYAKSLRTGLLTVEDVGKVAILGGHTEAIYVEVSRERAAALGVSVDRIYADLAKQNSVTPAGDVRVGDRRVAILPSGSIDSVAAIENVIVSPASVSTGASPSAGALVRLGDVAAVRRGYAEPPRMLVRYDGRPAVALGVANVAGANVAKMGAAIDAKLARTAATRPIGIEVHEFYHQGKVVDEAVWSFVLNVIAALVIVLVTLQVFMGLRSAAVIGSVLLLTIAATLAAMYAVGIPMHRISLGALIIALGMLVDNAIVVTEGILAGTRQGRKKLDAAREIVARTKWPLLGGTLVGILAFAPIGLASGSTAEYTGHLFWVVLISLLFSWLFAVTAAPLLADLLFPEGDAAMAGDRGEGRFRRGYKAFLRLALAGRWVVIPAAAGLFAASVYGFSYVKAGFFPASNTPQIVVDYWLPEGTDIARTEDDMVSLEGRVAVLEGVEAVQTLVGAGGLRYMLVYGPEPGNSAYGQLLVKVDAYERVGELMSRIQAMIDADYPDAQAKVWQFQLGPGGGSKIEAEFSGPDPAVLRRLANEAKAIMAADGRAISIRDDWREPVAVIQPRYSEARGRRLGVSREDLADTLETNFSGRNVGVFREEDTLIPIIARAPEDERRGAARMAGIQIPNRASGGVTPFLEVVDGLETVWRNGRLKRVDRVWTINAQCDPPPGELASQTLARLRPRIEAIDLPPGYRLEWGGEHGDSAEANSNLASALPMGFLAMVLVVVVLFNSVRQPLVIWLVAPLALAGVVLGLLVTGTPLEFVAVLGLLSLSGLLIKNAIVLVDQMDFEIGAGRPRHDAVLEAAASRVRPVAMGALTTMLGVIPLFGDAFFRSMAVVLVFGLGFATLLTLVVLPALYAAFFRIRASERAAQ